MRLLSIVVTYYPEKELLEKNIYAFIDYVDKVLIWENTPESERDKYRFVEHEKVEYHGDALNSISHALNYAWKYAVDNEYDYLLTMDQDSLWDNFEYFKKNTVGNVNVPYGIWCPQINDNVMTLLYQPTDSSITSGTLIPVDIISKVGGWNEFFAIDSVDTEFFAHVKSIGIGVYRIGNSLLVQRFGNPQKKKFFYCSFELRNDSPKRLYYIYRNYVIAMRKYPTNKSLRNGFHNVWLKRIKWILFFENDGLRKFLAILKGIFDGYKYNVMTL